jgi:hypothetical protein
MEGVFGNELWLSAVSNEVVVRALDEGGIPLEWILGGVAAVFFSFLSGLSPFFLTSFFLIIYFSGWYHLVFLCGTRT